MDGIIVSNPEIPGGTPAIAGTRVPVLIIECPEAGERLDDVLDAHPTVAREQAVAVCWIGPQRSAVPCAWQWIRRAGRCRPGFEFRQDTSELPVPAIFMIADRSRVQDFHALVPGVVEALCGHLRRRIRPVRV